MYFGFNHCDMAGNCTRYLLSLSTARYVKFAVLKLFCVVKDLVIAHKLQMMLEK